MARERARETQTQTRAFRHSRNLSPRRRRRRIRILARATPPHAAAGEERRCFFFFFSFSKEETSYGLCRVSWARRQITGLRCRDKPWKRSIYLFHYSNLSFSIEKTDFFNRPILSPSAILQTVLNDVAPHQSSYVVPCRPQERYIRFS